MYATFRRLHLTERIYAIEKVAKALTQLERVGGEGLGLYLWDQQIYQDDGNYPVAVKEQIRTWRKEACHFLQTSFLFQK